MHYCDIAFLKDLGLMLVWFEQALLENIKHFSLWCKYGWAPLSNGSFFGSLSVWSCLLAGTNLGKSRFAYIESFILYYVKSFRMGS